MTPPAGEGCSGAARSAGVAGSIAALLLLCTLAPAATRAAESEPFLVPCLGIAADSSPVFPTEVFPDPTTEVSVCFRLGEGDSAEKLTAVFIAEDVGAAAPPDYRILEAILELNGETQGRFRFENPRPMPLGTYRVEVSADGRPWASAAYAVVEAESPGEAGDLVPLEPGRRWIYRFEQRAGEGARIDLPDIEPDAEGVYRATVMIEVVAEEEPGFHLVTSRNGEPVFDEWWVRGDEGVLATQRKDAADLIRLDPPQLLAAAPGGEREWEYAPFAQEFGQHGPFSMRGDWGEGPGYVVVTRQAAPPFGVTVERHFVPGLGLVREIIIQALAGRMISRQEMVLRP